MYLNEDLRSMYMSLCSIYHISTVSYIISNAKYWFGFDRMIRWTVGVGVSFYRLQFWSEVVPYNHE